MPGLASARLETTSVDVSGSRKGAAPRGFLGVPSVSILFIDPDVFRTPSKTRGKQPVFEKNDA